MKRWSGVGVEGRNPFGITPTFLGFGPAKGWLHTYSLCGIHAVRPKYDTL